MERKEDFMMRILDNLIKMGEKEKGEGKGEKEGENLGREEKRIKSDERIEVDVRVEIILDEILVGKGNILKLNWKVKKRIIIDEKIEEELMEGIMNDIGERIVVIVKEMEEENKKERIVIVFRNGDILRDKVKREDLRKNVERRLIGEEMRREKEEGKERGNEGKRVWKRREGEEEGRGGGIMLVIRMKDENEVNGERKKRVKIVILERKGEENVKEVRREIEVVIRI